MDRKDIAARIVKGADMHRVAERLILELKQDGRYFKPIAAANLTTLYGISFEDALAVVSEMDLTPYTDGV